MIQTIFVRSMRAGLAGLALLLFVGQAAAQVPAARLEGNQLITGQAQILGSGGLLLSNSESVSNGTDGTLFLGRDDSGTVTVTAKDDNATAALTIKPGGAAAMVLGGASATSITLTTDAGSVVVDGTLNGVAPAGITADPTAGTWTFAKSSGGTAAIIGADDAGAADLLLDTTGAGAITLGSIDVTSVTVIADNDTIIRNGATGAVTLDFRDYADTTDDDMAHAILTTNCTDAGSATEDCDFSIGVVEGGAAAETRLLIDADGGVTLGSANTNSLTVTTDGTGDAEVVLPTGAVSTGEVLNGTLLAADQAYPGRGRFTVCGDATTVNNNTIYYGPSMVLVSSATVGLARKCDTTAAGNATEGTADELAFTAQAFQILAMDCLHPDANAALTFTARTAAGATVPSVTCTDADNDLGCTANVQTTTAVASGATFAVAVSSTGDIGTVPFVCTVDVAF